MLLLCDKTYTPLIELNMELPAPYDGLSNFTAPSIRQQCNGSFVMSFMQGREYSFSGDYYQYPGNTFVYVIDNQTQKDNFTVGWRDP